MRRMLRWSGLVSAMAAATLCVAVPAQAHVQRIQWAKLSLTQTITVQKRLIVQDWKVISTWETRRAHMIHQGALWRPEPLEVRWHIAHMRWTKRELHERQRALASRQRATARSARAAPTGFPPHHALWVCIGGYEGSPTSVNPNGHYGMLQMTYNWMGLINGRASDYPQAVQEWAAENAWKANHYSYAFLYGQWFAYDNADGCY